MAVSGRSDVACPFRDSSGSAAQQAWADERRELQGKLKSAQEQIQALSTTNARLLERWRQAWKHARAGDGAEPRRPER